MESTAGKKSAPKTLEHRWTRSCLYSLYTGFAHMHGRHTLDDCKLTRTKQLHMKNNNLFVMHWALRMHSNLWDYVRVECVVQWQQQYTANSLTFELQLLRRPSRLHLTCFRCSGWLKSEHNNRSTSQAQRTPKKKQKKKTNNKSIHMLLCTIECGKY